MLKILLVEDDPGIVENLSEFLRAEGYALRTAPGQRAALERMREEPFDLLLLDISLQDGNGYALCAAAREITDAPVIFLTASDDEYSVVAALDMGAYDFVVKPFRPRELASRIRSALRRGGRAPKVYELGPVRLDAVRGTATKDGRDLNLSALEYRLLLTLLNNRGMVLTREKLLGEIWDAAGDFVSDNTLTVYIKRLREKLEDDPQNPKLILTVRGLGYKAGE